MWPLYSYGDVEGINCICTGQSLSRIVGVLAQRHRMSCTSDRIKRLRRRLSLASQELTNVGRRLPRPSNRSVAIHLVRDMLIGINALFQLPSLCLLSTSSPCLLLLCFLWTEKVECSVDRILGQAVLTALPHGASLFQQPPLLRLRLGLVVR